MNGGAAIGSMWNDTLGMVVDGIQAGKSQQDQANIRAAYDRLMRTPNLDPQQLQIIAQQMGVQPDVLASQYRSNQLNALRQMQNIAARGGLDDAAIAANQQAGMRAERQNQADTQAINAGLARRGLNAGSGAQLAQKQMSAQAAYNTTAMQGANNAAAAQLRALQAIQASGRLAGDLASADEQRNAENAARRMQTDRYNTSIRNAANQFNSNAVLNAAGFNQNKAKDTMNAATQSASGGRGLRDEQTGYWRDFGNRGQNIATNVGNMGRGGGGMPF